MSITIDRIVALSAPNCEKQNIDLDCLESYHGVYYHRYYLECEGHQTCSITDDDTQASKCPGKSFDMVLVEYGCTSSSKNPIDFLLFSP